MTIFNGAGTPTVTSHFINGEWTAPGGPTFPVTNPLNDDLVADAAAGGADEAEAAVAAAAAAFPAWANMAPGERQRLFLKAADIVERRTEELVELMAVEGGASRAFSAFQIRLSAAMLRQAASWGYLPVGDVIRSDTPGRTATVTRKPLGVVAGFTPWNGAFYLAWRTFLLPMAFGNTTVIKPSELAPMSSGLIHAEILEEAGFPAGHLQRVTHAPGEAAADRRRLLRRARPCAASTSPARTRPPASSARRPGRALKRMVLELGGFNPVILLDDADIEESIKAVTFGAFLHQGQVCMNSRKVYVARSIHDEFVVGPGRPGRGAQDRRPDRSRRHHRPAHQRRAPSQQIDARVQDALDRGATLVTGGTSEGRVYAADDPHRCARRRDLHHRERRDLRPAAGHRGLRRPRRGARATRRTPPTGSAHRS